MILWFAAFVLLWTLGNVWRLGMKDEISRIALRPDALLRRMEGGEEERRDMGCDRTADLARWHAVAAAQPSSPKAA